MRQVTAQVSASLFLEVSQDLDADAPSDDDVRRAVADVLGNAGADWDLIDWRTDDGEGA